MDTTPHCSRVVPHPSTERAQTALTSVFGWEPVDYSWYGRIRYVEEVTLFLSATPWPIQPMFRESKKSIES